MSKINILSSKIFNRISAGEVIERPASVVKELVENSIDAGANNILIEIIDGGITEIKITDNGCGIEKTELAKSILPHATSKISKVEDLDAIKTLGFRGEALASVVSVSKFTIETKTKDDEVGSILKCEGGENIDIFDSPSELGTTITVNNLFYNTPVRARFLKTPKSEENEITAVVARIILGNSNLKITYKADGKVIYQSFGEGLESAFLSIYGLETLKNCHFIQTEKNGVKIEGYISKPLFSKANRSYQTTFLNGRYIINQTVSSSISNAYAPYMMKRQYPLYLLLISLPNEYVDVNVHPNKIDVRFMNNQIVYGAIYSVISKVLDGTLDVLNIVVPEKKLEVEPKKQEYKFVNNSDDKFSFEKVTLNDSKVVKSIEEKQQESTGYNDIFLENKLYIEKLEKEKKNAEVQSEIKISKELKVIGQALNTFIVLEDGTDLYLIDQHAAHERLLFDKIVSNNKTKNYEIQPLLLPFILETNSSEYDFMLSKLDSLKEFGLDIEEFGGKSFKVSSIPVYLTNIDLKKFFNEILSDMNTLKNLTMKDLLMEKFAQKACKSAIKSGDKLDDSEIKALLDMIGGNLSLKCPHGRPVTVKITRNEIDKWFKRIV